MNGSNNNIPNMVIVSLVEYTWKEIHHFHLCEKVPAEIKTNIIQSSNEYN